MVYGILITPDTATKAKTFLNALHHAAQSKGIPVKVFESYQPCDVLILYGLGGISRIAAAQHHQSYGKPFIAWDLPYWKRDGRTFRMSVNGNHPYSVMQGPLRDAQRFNVMMLNTGNVSDPNGPIMLIGNGPKSNAVGADGWAKRKAKEITAFFDHRLIYRPKPRRPIDKGCELLPQSIDPIDQALRGISFIVCRHSNVAVDACRMGVPVVCDDGAASAIYPQSLIDKDNQPSEATRLEFLQRLAWWQYSNNEAGLAWEWIPFALTLDAGTGSKKTISI